MNNKNIEMRLEGQPYNISYFIREAGPNTLLFLHGLGCSMDDYREAQNHVGLKEYTLVGLDFPGHGSSSYHSRYPLSVDDLANATSRFIEALDLQNVTLVGHSMGGLVALLLLYNQRNNFSGFINVEGNLAPEDCIFTREIVKYGRKVFIEKRLPQLKEKVKKENKPGTDQFLKDVNRCNPWAYYDFSPSTVAYSDNGDLLHRFLTLELPKQFIFGQENAGLSYLPKLRSSDVTVDEIPCGTHFMYADNPGYFYSVIVEFVSQIS